LQFKNPFRGLMNTMILLSHQKSRYSILAQIQAHGIALGGPTEQSAAAITGVKAISSDTESAPEKPVSTPEMTEEEVTALAARYIRAGLHAAPFETTFEYVDTNTLLMTLLNGKKRLVTVSVP